MFWIVIIVSSYLTVHANLIYINTCFTPNVAGSWRALNQATSFFARLRFPQPYPPLLPHKTTLLFRQPFLPNLKIVEVSERCMGTNRRYFVQRKAREVPQPLDYIADHNRMQCRDYVLKLGEIWPWTTNRVNNGLSR